MNITKVLSDNRSSQAAIGITRKAFKKLLPIFEEAFIKCKKKNTYRGGRPYKLKTMEERLLFILYYLKNYPTFDVLGIQFGMNRSSAYKRVIEFLHVLKVALKNSESLPSESIRELNKVIRDEKLIIIDGTEQRKNRPKNSKIQREYYSGKKNSTQ